MIITRYADDVVIGFEREADARLFLGMMRERFEAFALTLHQERTRLRLIEFGRLPCIIERGAGAASRRPSTF